MACQAVYGDKTKIDKLDELRISGTLRRLHFENPLKRVEGKVVRRWVPKPKALERLKEIKTYQNEF